MRVLITGTSSGIGRAIAEVFLGCGEPYDVIGFDVSEATIDHERYTHYIVDVTKPENFPELPRIDILINNAGIQGDSDETIEVNLRGVINITEKYGLHRGIFSIVNIASTSAHNGAEFPRYAASKGGVRTYTKWAALEVAKYGATCNSVSPGGVITPVNDHILNDPKLTKAVMAENLLGKWATAGEIADLVFFLATINRSITGQDIIIDNGEISKANFIW